MAYKQTQTWKTSKPVKSGESWRIRRHDGELVGYYATCELAQRHIDTAFYLR